MFMFYTKNDITADTSRKYQTKWKTLFHTKDILYAIQFIMHAEEVIQFPASQILLSNKHFKKVSVYQLINQIPKITTFYLFTLSSLFEYLSLFSDEKRRL